MRIIVILEYVALITLTLDRTCSLSRTVWKYQVDELKASHSHVTAKPRLWLYPTAHGLSLTSRRARFYSRYIRVCLKQEYQQFKINTHTVVHGVTPSEKDMYNIFQVNVKDRNMDFTVQVDTSDFAASITCSVASICLGTLVGWDFTKAIDKSSIIVKNDMGCLLVPFLRSGYCDLPEWGVNYLHLGHCNSCIGVSE